MRVAHPRAAPQAPVHGYLSSVSPSSFLLSWRSRLSCWNSFASLGYVAAVHLKVSSMHRSTPSRCTAVPYSWRATVRRLWARCSVSLGSLLDLALLSLTKQALARLLAHAWPSVDR